MSTKRQLARKRMSLFLIITLLASLVAVIPASAAQSPQVPLPGSAIPQFAQPLPLLNIGGGPGPGIRSYVGSQPLEVHLCEFWANVLPPGTFVPGLQPKTRVWGYIVRKHVPAEWAK